MENIEENFKAETKTISFLIKALFFLIHLAIMTEIIAGIKFRLILKLIFFLYFKKPYLKTIKNRYYTYWTFSLALLGYTLWLGHEHFFVTEMYHISALYILAALTLLIKMYILSSPIYYPRVSWWEYDFRFRDDLSITIKVQEFEYQARLTDLRRLAGCIALFQELKLGQELLINTRVEEESVSLRAVVMTKRRELLGRPLIYGVQFKFENRRHKKRYIALMKIWKRDRKLKKIMKLFNHE